MCVCIRTYICLYTCLYAFIYVYIALYIHILSVWLEPSACLLITYTDAHTYTHSHTHSHTHTHTHTHTHIHTHMHTHAYQSYAQNAFRILTGTKCISAQKEVLSFISEYSDNALKKRQNAEIHVCIKSISTQPVKFCQKKREKYA